MDRRRISPTIALLTILSLALTLTTGAFAERQSDAGETHEGSQRSKRVDSQSYPTLSRYAQNLTATARLRRQPLVSKDRIAIDQAIEVLSTAQRNPVVIEDPQLNTHAIAMGIAQRIASGRVPSVLKNKQLFSLNLDALFAGLKTPAEVDARLKSIFDEAANSKGEVILFLDQLYQFVGTRVSPTTSDNLRNRLERHDLQVVGATTNEAYEQYIAADNSLRRVFKTIRTSNEQTTASANDEDFVGDNVSSDLREKIANGQPSDRVSVILQVDDVRNQRLLRP